MKKNILSQVLIHKNANHCKNNKKNFFIYFKKKIGFKI